MSTELVTSAGVIDAIRERGGALYVWPRKARCCGGTITLEAATEPPNKVFRRIEAEEIDLFVAAGMTPPESLHVEISRRGRIRAFWNGLAWVEAKPAPTKPPRRQRRRRTSRPATQPTAEKTGMAYDETLADRVCDILEGDPGVSERKMFGGLAFMIDGHMTCGIVGDDLMLRLGADAAESALRKPHTRPMDFTGRPMTGMVFVEKAGLLGASLKRWVTAASNYARTLPPKH